MRTLCIQFQPKRAPDLAIEVVTALMARIAIASPDVREFTMQRGSARSPYINYSFTARAPLRVWQALHSKAFAHRKWGPRLGRATIATCQGAQGWDDYLLLHHFDPRQRLDIMAGA